MQMVLDYISGGGLGVIGVALGNLFYTYAVPHLGKGWNIDD